MVFVALVIPFWKVKGTSYDIEVLIMLVTLPLVSTVITGIKVDEP